MPRTAIDMARLRFGRMRVISRAGSISKAASWECKCDCGAKFIAIGSNIRRGDTTSCGCFRSEVTSTRSLKHGHMAGSTRTKRLTTKTYRCWANMLNRCRNSNSDRWLYYGGRGISVCARWHIFENFLSDMGAAPPGLTIERKDNDKGYEPGNCVWATYSEQNKNRRPFGQGRRVEVT